MLAILTIAAALSAAEPADPPHGILDQLRAADTARSELAREEAAWVIERQRLQALVDSTRAETMRLDREAAAAATARDEAQRRLAEADGAASGIAALRSRLDDAAAATATSLARLGAGLPPGALPRPADGGFEAVARAVEAAERTAGEVRVVIATGVRQDRTMAAKVLRAAGAAAWWISLDGLAAGTVRMVDGAPRFIDAAPAGVAAIRAAVAQAEGRARPELLMLPETGR